MSTRYTLNDKLVRDGLASVARVSPHGIYLAGGIANQLYIYPHYPGLLRPTNDADFARTQPIDHATFDEIYEASKTPLGQYKLRRGRDREGFFIHLSDDTLPFFIHFEKTTKPHWEKVKGTKERQYSTSNEVVIPETTSRIKIVRPEEIVLGKVRRLSYLAKKGMLTPESYRSYQVVVNREFEKLGDLDLSAQLSKLSDLKDSLSGHFEASVEQGTHARQVYNGEKDIYDISLLFNLIAVRQVGFDDAYYDDILKDVTFS